MEWWRMAEYWSQSLIQMGGSAAVALIIREYFISRRSKTEADRTLGVAQIEAETKINEIESTSIVPRLLDHMAGLDAKNGELLVKLTEAQATIGELKAKVGKLEAQVAAIEDLNSRLLNQNQLIVEQNAVLTVQNQKLVDNLQVISKALTWYETNNSALKRALEKCESGDESTVLVKPD